MLSQRWMQGFDPALANHRNRGQAGTVSRLLLCLLIWLLPGFLCSSCGDPNDIAEDISDTSPEERVLTQATHPDGWGLSECVLCHPLFKIHVKTSDPRVDLEKIQEVVDRLGQDSCVYCHGENGT